MKTLLDILRYPLQITLLSTTVFLTLLLWVASYAGLFGMPLMFFVAVALLRMGFTVLLCSANGEREVPPLGADDFFVFKDSILLQLVALLLAGILLFSVVRLAGSVQLNLLALLVLFAAWPAMLAILGVRRDFLAAINPVNILRFIVSIGPAYLIVPLIPFALILLTGMLGRAGIWPFVIDLLLLSSSFMLLHVLGRLMHARRERLGLDVTVDPEREAERELHERREQLKQALGEAYQQSRTDPAMALRLIQDLLDALDATLEERLWLFERIRDWPDSRTALRFAQDLIGRELRAQHAASALELTAWGLTAEPRFRPAGERETLLVAQFAARNSRPKVATALLADVGQRFPDGAQTSAAMLFAAQLALQKTSETDLARRLLAQVEARGVPASNARLAQLRALLPCESA